MKKYKIDVYMNLNYPKIKKRFPIAYKKLSELSFKTKITEIRTLVYYYFNQYGLSDSYSLIGDLKSIESGKYKIEAIGMSCELKFKSEQVKMLEQTLITLNLIYGYNHK